MEFVGEIATTQEVKNIFTSNTASQVGRGQIFLDGRDRLPILLDKKHRGCAATEGLDPQCATSGKKIENSRADHAIGQTGKNSRFHAIHRGTDAAFRNNETD